ncbi:type VI secretion system Vgr family protein [Massilia sp. CFBP9026]|uniref:type VI secretion system Vgr family protein n=1 Tax=Massilia sp. CFBP9026 TaxID=3096536 RepID=UPI002A6ABCED|nr:type VI secretion system Vgr family protein [Massilia sp. CFBP9026]MDY0962579.1 type VI secretion system Vgr family protein [Massilia sp. CFBP9026]
MIIDKIAAGVSSLTDMNRAIRLRLSTPSGIVDDLLLVKYVSGVETICGGIEYALQCVSLQAGMELKRFIANPVELQFVTDSGKLRTVCGIIGGVSEGQSDGGLATYQLMVRDALSLLEQTCNTRVFRNRNEIDITETILREWRLANPIAAAAFRFESVGLKQYPPREFTMQYNESNAAFLRRLWKRRGIAWFIKAGASNERGSSDVPVHTLVLFDSPNALEQNPAGAARYHRDHGTEQRDSITSWHAVRKLTAGRVNRHSWDYAQTWSMSSQETSLVDQGAMGNQFAASLDEYLIDSPHAGDNADDYRSLGVLRMQRKEYEAKFFQGEGGDRDMRVGQWRRMNGHPEIDTHPADQREFVCTELRVEAENNLPKTLDEKIGRLFSLNRWSSDRAALLQASAERGVRYTNRFTCVRRGTPIVPAYDPRIELPRTEAQTAIVVGPANQEIHCDERGRIKVRFPACRSEDHAHADGAGASGSDRDSAWLRVASGWAGNQYGAISLPRVGDEVVVVFMGGDPDKPLVIGNVHGARTPSPSFSRNSVLPGDKHLSGIVSKEGQGTRANQLRMDDTPGQISAQLGSEHAHSQLNLGYLTHPRRDGSAEPRGEGAELRTDAALSLRGGQGILISADASLRAAGRLLDRDGLAGLSEALSGIQKQLAELAEAHETDAVESDSLTQLKTHLEKWEEGSNTAGQSASGNSEGRIVAIEAPSGVLVGSQTGVAIGAQTHIDLLSVRNTQVSAGRKLLLHALQGISVFAHSLGAKLVAGSGKVEIEAQDENVEITAAKRIVLAASEEIVLQSPKVTIITQGAQVAFGDGGITHHCTGNFVVKAAKFEFPGAGGSEKVVMRMPESVVKHNQRVRMVDLSTGSPMVGQRYRVTLEDGQIIEGCTDADGMTQDFTSEIPFAHYDIEAIDE